MNTNGRENIQICRDQEVAAAAISRGDATVASPKRRVRTSPALPWVISLAVVGLWLVHTGDGGSLPRTRDPNLGTATERVAPDPPAFNSTSCSCVAPWNDTATALERRRCCHRTVASAHKMGWQLLIKINRNYLARIPGGKVKKGELYNVEHITVDPLTRGAQYNTLMEHAVQTSLDYRTVIVTRHWYDVLVSGFLYHQSGRECSLSSAGKRGRSGWLQRFDWKAFLSAGNESSYYWGLQTEGSLCDYLNEVSLLDGMRVYMDFALKMWLRPVLRLAAARRSHPLSRARTLFLCYEQFNEDERAPAALKAAGSFLYPGEDVEQWDGVALRLRSNEGAGRGHATTKDASLRELLHGIVQFNDKAHFGGEVVEGSDSFACRSEREAG